MSELHIDSPLNVTSDPHERISFRKQRREARRLLNHLKEEEHEELATQGMYEEVKQKFFTLLELQLSTNEHLIVLLESGQITKATYFLHKENSSINALLQPQGHPAE